MSNNIIIGFDPGFGNGKAAKVNGNVKAVTISNVVGIGSLDVGLLGAGFNTTPNADQPHVVEFDNATYLVGQGVADYAKPIERMDFQRLADAPELKALFYATMYELVGTAASQANIVVGLPVEVMANTALARSIQNDLRSWMEATHENVIVNNQPLSLTVNRVCAIAQPAGAYFGWGMTNDGNWAKDAKLFRQMVAICDIGFNTVDLYTIKGGQVINRYTGGETAGMRRAAEIIMEDVRLKHGISLSLHEADDLLRKPELSTCDGLQDLTPLANQALEAVASGVLTLTERQWGRGRQFAHVLFTGGGAEALRSKLTRQYPHGIVLKNATTANAVGLAKFGQRVLV